ncbi:biotin-dependent carboxyltransferase family protein, partial [Nostoc sp. NIES-2111]
RHRRRPGRRGAGGRRSPRSGPWGACSSPPATRLGGTDGGGAALGCWIRGPGRVFPGVGVVAVTGADRDARLDGEPVPMWTGIAVKGGQVLALGSARTGARSYIAIDGAIDTPPVLGSRSTFHMAGVGGVEGFAVKAGQTVPLGAGGGAAGWTVAETARPVIGETKRWTVCAVPGPDDDWIDEAGHARFLSADWTIQAKSNRTGIRLTGPEFSFTRRAYDKRPEHGQDPSNILDHGYPVGSVNLAGQTPIILAVDGPSTGGFINPYTVPSAEFWKLGQARPWDVLSFKAVSGKEALEMRRSIAGLCTADSLVRAWGRLPRSIPPRSRSSTASSSPASTRWASSPRAPA